MARTMTEIITCDRCGVRISEPYAGGESGTFRLHMSVSGVVTGHSIIWTELCGVCNTHVGDIIHRETKLSKELREALNIGGAGDD